MNSKTIAPTPWVAEQVQRANDSGKQPVVFVHGLWLLAESWKPWQVHFEASGFSTVSIDWPGDQASYAEAHAHSDSLAGLSVTEIADYITRVISALDKKPIVIGHSLGGLLAQMIAGRGLAAASVAIDPAPCRGVLPVPLSTIKASFPVLGNPLNWSRTVTLTFDQFRYGFANAIPEAEARELYNTAHTPAPGKPLFQAGTANLTPWAAAQADNKHPQRGPMLIVAGEKDTIVPVSVARAAYKRQLKNSAPTEFEIISGVGHSLIIDSGWKTVADVAINFIAKHLPQAPKSS